MIEIIVYRESEEQEGFYDYDTMLINPNQIVSITSLPDNDDVYQLTLPNIDDCYLTDEAGKNRIVGALE